ncbi:hypothetical protein LZC13_09490, partial [Campylobacter coli]|nr:hypothetical protein [Campylobacter coli]
VEIEPGIHGAVRSFPGDVEPGATLFAKDASWPALQGVTTREGKPVDAACVPFAGQAEDLLQLTDIGGSLALHY